MYVRTYSTNVQSITLLKTVLQSYSLKPSLLYSLVVMTGISNKNTISYIRVGIPEARGAAAESRETLN